MKNEVINTPTNKIRHTNYEDYTILFNTEDYTFEAYYKKEKFVECKLEGFYKNGEKAADFSDFAYCLVRQGYKKTNNSQISLAFFDEVPNINMWYEADKEPVYTILLKPSNYNVAVEVMKADGVEVKVSGVICHASEDKDDVFAISVGREVRDVRSGIGAAISTIDNAIYNRRLDRAVVVGEPKKTKLSYDKANGEYCFEAYADSENELEMGVKEDILAKEYHIKFNPINKNATFSKPPVGWMTWYAVKFDASEETVLENAKFQAEKLKDYGANTIWVDWEWYHKDIPAERTDGVNSLMCDPVMYPNGMKYVADKIRELGFVPSIWIGYVHEPGPNKYTEKYPEMVLAEYHTWCGYYFYDYTNPHYLNEYLPEALNQVHEWGYDAVKFDVLPSSMMVNDTYHDRMYDPTQTTYEAYRNMLKKTREVLGKDMYMLSCSGATQPSVLWASDIFDAARIGDDIFTWEENIKNLGRIQEFYPLHNIQLHVDADNVVIREEFNNIEQAKSRAVSISLLGLPFTFGDDFKVLDEERVDILRRALPIIDMHPMDLAPADFNTEDMLINLNIVKDYESYTVSGVFNLKETAEKRTVKLDEDLHLADGGYLVYDYFRNEFLGIFDKEIELDFVPYEVRVLAVRPYKAVPQVVSTSRHITQGAAEIKAMSYENGTIKLTSDLVKNDEYTVSVYIPDGYSITDQTGFSNVSRNGNILRLTFVPEETKEYSFTISFTK
ncbi:MAG: alpha-galactosidase [Clostridia bacterium]|nr:alpha-galactosidase [Clostridia bacterium]